MQTFKKIGEGFLWGGMIFLLVIVAFEQWLYIPSWLKIAGRMHPMFLHFPIVLILLSFLSLWIPSHEERVWHWFDGLRLIAALSAIVTAIMGLILSLEEQTVTKVLTWHKWGGVVVAICGTLFYFYTDFFIRHKHTGKLFTLFGGLIIFLTGHWGAAITHGDNYLLAPIDEVKKVPVDQAVVFEDVIKPILEKKCASCHGGSNVKGGLVVSSLDGMIKGGKAGPLFLAGQPEMSLLIERIHLPVNDKKHMPPKSKPQLTEEESALLYAWIQSGALLDQKLTTLPVQDTFRQLASRFLGSGNEVAAAGTIYEFPAASSKTIQDLNNNYRVIRPLGVGSPALSVHFYGKSNFNAKALEELKPVQQQVIELSLANMPVKDADLKLVSQLPNLMKLNLNYTDISSAGLQHLQAMKKLQHITLSGTQVKTTGLEALSGLPQLKEIYIWDTPNDSAEVTAFRNKYKNLYIETGYADNGEIKLPMSPPVFVTASSVFDKKTLVEIKHPFKGAEIRFTTNGKLPDSLVSEIYTKPFAIDSNTKITARAFKNGWYGSTPSTSTYIRRTYKPDSVELISAPDPRYRGETNALLTDGNLGELQFDNGQWLGYQKNEASYYLYFNNAVPVKQVLLSMLQNIGAHILPPAKLTVWGGTEKNKMKLLGTVQPVLPKKDEASKLLTEAVSFQDTPVRYLKIEVIPVKALPKWHSSKGKPAWVMVNEIVVN